MTTRDDQTGLMNFGAFAFVVDHVVKRASRSGECATVLSIRIEEADGARRGSGAPDPAAVYRVARMLRTELRGEDVVARVGDREFGVALPDTDAEQAEIVVGWIGDKLATSAGTAVGAPARTYLVGRATFEPTNGPVAAEVLLEAARVSTAGPSHVAGSEARAGRGVSSGDSARAEGGSRRASSRRHLRPLRAKDA